MTLIVWEEFPWLLGEKNLVGRSKLEDQPGAAPRSVKAECRAVSSAGGMARGGGYPHCVVSGCLPLPREVIGTRRLPGRVRDIDAHLRLWIYESSCSWK